MDKADMISASVCPQFEEGAGGLFLYAPAQRMGRGRSCTSDQLLSRMQRVESSFSTRQQEPGKKRVPSRCSSVALAEQNQVATLPVRLLKNDLAVAPGNSCADASFQMKIDAHGFAPEELMVRVDGQNLTVTGQQQRECNDRVMGRYRTEQTVHQQMQLPLNLDPAAMTCSLTPSGHLWIQGQNRSLPPSKAQTGHAPRPGSQGSKGSN